MINTNYIIDKDRSIILFNQLIELDNYTIDIGDHLEFKWSLNYYYIVISDRRKFEEEDINIIPGKIVLITTKEELLSYRLNTIIFKEYNEKDFTRNI